MLRTTTALLALLLAAPAAAAAEIDPAGAIAGARLGMTVAELEAQLGPPAATEEGVQRWATPEIEVQLLDGRAARITTASNDLRTAGGLGRGTGGRGLAREGARCLSTSTGAGVCSFTSSGRGVATRFHLRRGRAVRVAVERIDQALVPELPPGRRIVLGRSPQGRPIVARRIGDPDSPRKALVTAATHGDEPGSPRPVRALRGRAADGVDVWLIERVNPDGLAVGRRQTAAGIDLNRHFSAGWRRTGPPGSRFYAGPRPFVAPEARLFRDVVELLRPAVSMHFHQPYGYVILPIGGDHAIPRRYARLAGTGLGDPPGPRSPGQVSTWQNARFPGTTAFIVELGAAPPGRAETRRHARAALAIAEG